MRSASGPAPGAEILQEAARWFVLLASGEATESDRHRWMAWRAADARHEAAWQRAEAVTSPLAGIPGEQVGASMSALDGAASRRTRRRALGGIAGLFAAGLFGLQGWWRSDLSADALTVAGEQRDLRLEDGSHLRLDTDTAIDIRFDSRQRLVHLRRGRVLIETGHAADGAGQPPLRVETAQGIVQALGTRFVIRQQSGSTEVAVLEHRVAVHAGSAANGADPTHGSVILAAGEAVRFARQGVYERRPARPGDSAWVRGMLIADDMALIDFIAELARYRAVPLACDPAVQQLRISGTYPLTDIDGALASLVRALPVRVEALKAGRPGSGSIVRPR
jgi:transmembrane sensor